MIKGELYTGDNINAALVILGLYLIIRSIINIHHHDQHIKELKLRHSLIADIID